MAKQHKDRKESVNKENVESLLETKRTMTPTRPAFGTSVMQDSLRLLDAHLIFEPILTCLGVMPQQMVNNITNAGKDSHFKYIQLICFSDFFVRIFFFRYAIVG